MYIHVCYVHASICVLCRGICDSYMHVHVFIDMWIHLCAFACVVCACILCCVCIVCAMRICYMFTVFKNVCCVCVMFMHACVMPICAHMYCCMQPCMYILWAYMFVLYGYIWMQVGIKAQWLPGPFFDPGTWRHHRLWLQDTEISSSIWAASFLPAFIGLESTTAAAGGEKLSRVLPGTGPCILQYWPAWKEVHIGVMTVWQGYKNKQLLSDQIWGLPWRGESMSGIINLLKTSCLLWYC